MSPRYAFLFVSTRGRPFDFDPEIHANDDWRPDVPGGAAHAFLQALLSDPGAHEPHRAP